MDYIIAERIEDLLSQSMYVRTCIRTYVHGGSRSGMPRGMSLHTIGIGYICTL